MTDTGFTLSERPSVPNKCTEPGAIGALLRREGLYSSQLATWRRQRAEGTLADKPHGRPAEPLAAEKGSGCNKLVLLKNKDHEINL